MVTFSEEILNEKLHFLCGINTLNYREESINIYDTGDESDYESDFPTNIDDHDSTDIDFFPWNIFIVM